MAESRSTRARDAVGNRKVQVDSGTGKGRSSEGETSRGRPRLHPRAVGHAGLGLQLERSSDGDQLRCRKRSGSSLSSSASASTLGGFCEVVVEARVGGPGEVLRPRVAGQGDERHRAQRRVRAASSGPRAASCAGNQDEGNARHRSGSLEPPRGPFTAGRSEGPRRRSGTGSRLRVETWRGGHSAATACHCRE